MSSALLLPDEEMIQGRRRFSVDEWYQMRDLGLLDGRFEILDGAAIEKRGQKPAHYFALMQLSHWAAKVFGIGLVRTQGPISIPVPEGLYNEPEPDLAVTREDTTAYADRHPGPEDLALVVEVSDTTLRTDLIVKARLYARAGIPEYWTVDLAARQLHAHRNPVNGEYTEAIVYNESDSAVPYSRPDAGLLVREVLPAVPSA